MKVTERDILARLERSAKIGAWTYDLATGKTWCSDGVWPILRVEKKDACEGLDCLRAHLTSESKDELQRALDSLTSGREKGFAIRLVAKSAVGDELILRLEAELLQEAGSSIVLGTMQDVTEAQRASQEAERNETFLASIIAHIPAMVFVKEAKDLRFVLFNRAGEELTGIPAENILGKNDYDFFPKEQADFFVKKDRQALAGDTSVDVSGEPLDTPNGKRILHTRKISIKDKSGNPAYLLGVSLDVTEKVESERRLKEQEMALASSARLSALGQMAGGIAHEINNPLAIIRATAGQIRRLTRRQGRADERLDELCHRIERTIDRIATIIKGLRDFSRDGSSDPFQVVSIQKLLDETIGFCQQRFRNHGVQLHLDPGMAGLTVECQPVRLSQVLVNLLNNAFDAVRHQREKVVRLTCVEGGRGVRIIVEDTGPGVPDEIRERITEPFFTTKPVGEGTGLGLSLSRGIVEDHGGELKLEPSKVGARFVIDLPTRQAATARSA